MDGCTTQPRIRSSCITGRRLSAFALAIVLITCGQAKVEPPPIVISASPAPAPATGGLPWDAPVDPMAATIAAGLQPETHETLVNHVHSHLDVFVNGEHVKVPAGIGIDITNPSVHSLKTPDGSLAWGNIKPNCKRSCISPLHTHGDSGKLHTESASSRPNRLGEFFAEWGIRLDHDCVGGFCRPLASIFVFVDGNRYGGDPAAIQLTNLSEIAIVIGSPPARVPVSGDFSQI
jgi:hypothetical protein